MLSFEYRFQKNSNKSVGKAVSDPPVITVSTDTRTNVDLLRVPISQAPCNTIPCGQGSDLVLDPGIAIPSLQSDVPPLLTWEELHSLLKDPMNLSHGTTSPATIASHVRVRCTLRSIRYPGSLSSWMMQDEGISSRCECMSSLISKVWRSKPVINGKYAEGYEDCVYYPMTFILGAPLPTPLPPSEEEASVGSVMSSTGSATEYESDHSNCDTKQGHILQGAWRKSLTDALSQYFTAFDYNSQEEGKIYAGAGTQRGIYSQCSINTSGVATAPARTFPSTLTVTVPSEYVPLLLGQIPACLLSHSLGILMRDRIQQSHPLGTDPVNNSSPSSQNSDSTDEFELPTVLQINPSIDLPPNIPTPASAVYVYNYAAAVWNILVALEEVVNMESELEVYLYIRKENVYPFIPGVTSQCGSIPENNNPTQAQEVTAAKWTIELLKII